MCLRVHEQAQRHFLFAFNLNDLALLYRLHPDEEGLNNVTALQGFLGMPGSLCRFFACVVCMDYFFEGFHCRYAFCHVLVRALPSRLDIRSRWDIYDMHRIKEHFLPPAFSFDTKCTGHVSPEYVL